MKSNAWPCPRQASIMLILWTFMDNRVPRLFLNNSFQVIKLCFMSLVKDPQVICKCLQTESLLLSCVQKKGVFWSFKAKAQEKMTSISQPRSVMSKVNVGERSTPCQSIFPTKASRAGEIHFSTHCFFFHFPSGTGNQPPDETESGTSLQLWGCSQPQVPSFCCPYMQLWIFIYWCDQARAQQSNILRSGAREGAGPTISVDRKRRKDPTNQRHTVTLSPCEPRFEKIVLPWACQIKALWSSKALPDTHTHTTTSSTHMNHSDMLISTWAAWGKALFTGLCIPHHQYARDFSKS